MRHMSHVLVIGDVMLDVWLHGQMTRVSPEAPSPVVLVGEQTRTAGGAANVAVNLAAMGQHPLLLGVVGDDPNGSTLQEMLIAARVTVNLVRSDDTATIQKTRVLSGGQQVMRLDTERSSATYGDGVASRMRAGFLAALGLDIQAIVISDYGKGAITEALARFIVATSIERGIPLFVDTKPGRQDWYKCATLLKPNLTEARQMCEEPPALFHPAMFMGDEEEQAASMCKHLLHTYGFRTVAITRGARGATCYDGTEEPFTSSVTTQEVFDVTGAGDTFLAALVDAFLQGTAFAPSIVRANTAASVAIRHRQTYAVSRTELDDAVRDRNGVRGKIMSMEQLVPWIERHRSAKHSIVMTNGCYRLLHHGHVESFRWAAHQGDVLIVAINSDAAIEVLKGAKPVIPESYRAEMIAQYPCVDAVVVFDDPDVTATVKAIKPDVLVKGAQYRETKVPGADYVAGRGGEVRFSPMVADISATVLQDSLG